jgi:Xaa-Pro dipeptidase
MSFLGFQALHGLLPEAQFVDASESLWATRAVKSATEILYLREVGRITGLAFDASIATARQGATELEAFREFAATCLKLGASRPGYFAMHSGRGQDTRSNRWPSERRLERGDLVWMDAGASYRGYWSDYTRMVSLGKPTQAQAGSYRFVYDVSRAILSLVRPGVTCEELMHECRRAFASTGRQIGNATRIGHGVGMDLTEPPSVVEGDTTRLEAGMVLAIEPGLRTDLGYFVVEENIVVTDTAFEYLSIPAPAQLPAND